MAQYRAFVKATGHRAPSCGGFDIQTARATQAIQCVSHGDARTYARWLSEISGERYGLVSAGEWEHAARAGTSTRFWSGHTLTPGSHAIAQATATPPDVGMHPANGFGLHDVIGGVAEIVDDCWETTLRDVPADGTPARTLTCHHRVLKDAAWTEPADRARVSARRSIPANMVRPGVGFRVVRFVR